MFAGLFENLQPARHTPIGAYSVVPSMILLFVCRLTTVDAWTSFVFMPRAPISLLIVLSAKCIFNQTTLFVQ